MPRKVKATIRPVHVAEGSSWTLMPTPTLTVRRATRAAGTEEGGFDDLVQKLEQTGRVEVVSDLQATSAPRRGALSEPLPIEVPAAPGERYAALVRHPSGALTVQVPAPSASRRIATFQIYARGTEEPGLRRGLGSFLRVVIFKAIGKVAGALVEKLAENWEKKRWEQRPRGWVRVTSESLLDAQAGRSPLKKATAADFKRRNLLLLHGTLSTTEGCFGKLVGTRGPDGRDFFAWASTIYGDAIFGFNHPTISVPLEDNATEMLEGLPAGELHFDVVTHSRGGLVLRQLVERRNVYPKAGRFVLDRAVLVAVPNEGTALASEKRWQDTVGWFANLLDMFPDNPLVDGVAFIAEGLNWLAQAAVGRLRGLAAMDPGDREIALLQDPPGPPAEAYCALVANFEPDRWAARLFDAGMDGFFSGANDLCVPSEGGWRADRESVAIPAERIGCYGPGGNLEGPGDVHHLNLFGQPATVAFLIRALSNQNPAPKALDPKSVLPFKGRFRGIASGMRPSAAAAPLAVVAAAVSPRVPSPSVGFLLQPCRSDALQLFILGLDSWVDDAEAGSQKPLIIAGYRNARVIAPFPTKGGEAGQAYREIIEKQRQLRKFTEGLANDPLNEAQLMDLGASLFHQLFPGAVRRLYDEVRSKNAGRRLDLILTSNIPWISDLPWEFAYDPDRENFLALEEINFTRNVMTSMPAEEIAPRAAPLRLLVASSAPTNAPQLSIAEEVELIVNTFRALEDAGLLVVDELAHATPALLQQRLYEAVLADRPFDALHFIGHGQFDPQRKEGVLLMEDENGVGFPVDAESLRQILCRRGLRLVFLNACESGVGALSDFNRGLAPRLVQGSLPTVIANQYAVLDRAAVIFAHQFYLALAFGASVGDAAREARVAVNYSLLGGSMDWAVPVVFAQNPGETLCRPPTGEVRRANVSPVLPPLAEAPTAVAATRSPAAPRPRSGASRPARKKTRQ